MVSGNKYKTIELLIKIKDMKLWTQKKAEIINNNYIHY